MRRWLLAIVLPFIAFVVMGSLCKDRYAPVTKVYVANWTENPFHPNGGDRLDVGCSRQIVSIEHAELADITIVRNGVKLATMTVVSKIDEDDEKDYEVAIRVTEPTAGHFEAAPDVAGIVAVLVYP